MDAICVLRQPRRPQVQVGAAQPGNPPSFNIPELPNSMVMVAVRARESLSRYLVKQRTWRRFIAGRGGCGLRLQGNPLVDNRRLQTEGELQRS